MSALDIDPSQSEFRQNPTYPQQRSGYVFSILQRTSLPQLCYIHQISERAVSVFAPTAIPSQAHLLFLITFYKFIVSIFFHYFQIFSRLNTMNRRDPPDSDRFIPYETYRYTILLCNAVIRYSVLSHPCRWIYRVATLRSM